MSVAAPPKASAAPPADPLALQFQPFSGAADASFWKELARLKVDRFGLSDAAVPLRGYWGVARRGAEHLARLFVDGASFPDEAGALPAGGRAGSECGAPGVLHNVNTAEDFKSFDKRALLAAQGERLWAALLPPAAAGGDEGAGALSAAMLDPSQLAPFTLLTFADLKKHTFLYWFAFPALPPAAAAPLRLAAPLATAAEALGFGGGGGAVWSKGAAAAVRAGLDALGWPTAFLVRLSPTAAQAAGAAAAEADEAAAADEAVAAGAATAVQVLPLSAWVDLSPEERVAVSAEPLFGSGGGGGSALLFGMVDPCGLPSAPGWPLRNLAMMLALGPCRDAAAAGGSVPVLCLRAERGGGAAGAAAAAAAAEPLSLLLRLALPSPAAAGAGGALPPKAAVGWAVNARGKAGPRVADLSSVLDPRKLADSAVDLNLKLMRWKQLPSLRVERLASQKVLLLGAGTLGCAVARTLLGWGVRHMTLVDNGRVSYSNPARQSLFEYVDVAGEPGSAAAAAGGAGAAKFKAEAAAAALLRVHPGMVARGVVLTVPMAGHAVAGEAATAAARADVDALTALVAEHDAVFLLTDTRESRWLPTLLCAATDTPLLNAALGFDTFLVMRHGARGAEAEAQGAAEVAEAEAEAAATVAAGKPRPAAHVPGCGLGCYFCSDIVAPQNSTANRTLDQQCTVTRPGLAPIAAALAVELFVGLVHHEQGHRAAAEEARAVFDQLPRPLGLLPHQVRGFVAHFGQIVATGHAFDRCTACSKTIVDEYRAKGFDGFLLRAFNEPKYLEELSGLAAMAAEAEAANWDVDGSGSDWGGSGEDDF